MHEKNEPLFTCLFIYTHFGCLSLELNRVPGVLLEPYMSQGGQGSAELPMVLKGLKKVLNFLVAKHNITHWQIQGLPTLRAPILSFWRTNFSKSRQELASLTGYCNVIWNYNVFQTQRKLLVSHKSTSRFNMHLVCSDKTLPCVQLRNASNINTIFYRFEYNNFGITAEYSNPCSPEEKNEQLRTQGKTANLLHMGNLTCNAFPNQS